MSSYQVLETKPDHHFRTEVPNLVLELGLSPFELAVYLVLKRIAGDSGQCTKRRCNLAKDCGMSESSLKKTIKSLKEKRKLLGDLPLIEVKEQVKEDGSPDVNIITITPIWRQNGDFFNQGGGSPKNRGEGRQKTEGGSPKTHKEERYKKNLKDKKNDKREKPPETIPSSPPPIADRSSNFQDFSIALFHPKTYRLPNGNALSTRCINSFMKYKGKDREKLLANVAYFNDYMAQPGSEKIRNQEAYLQKCINEDYAGKQTVAWQNRFFASWVIGEHKLEGFKILKTVLEMTMKDGQKCSLKFDIPSKEFEHRLKFYAKECFKVNI